MKLRGKILTIVLLPLFVLGMFIYILTSNTVEKVVKQELSLGLKANVSSLRDAIEMNSDGAYSVNEEGHMLKGDFDLTANCQRLVDNVRETTGVMLTVCYGDTRYLTGLLNEDGSAAIGTKISQEVADSVLNKGESVLSSIDVNGMPYYGYYEPIYDEGGRNGTTPVGLVFAGQNLESVIKEVHEINNTILIIIIVLIILCSSVAVIFVYNIITAMKHSVTAIDTVAKGDLRVSLNAKNLKRKDEVGEITRSIQRLVVSFGGIIGEVKEKTGVLNESSRKLRQTAEHTSKTIEQVEIAIQEIAEGATSQAVETQKASENVIVMGNMIEETTKEVEILQKNAYDMKVHSDEANKTIQELQEINQKSQKSIDVIYQQTVHTNESAQKIREAITLITSIAEETNLLSLNATIEAARAGEQGKGFAVVATQIQKLAEQSNESAQQIEKIITSLMSDSTQAVETMQEVKEIIGYQNENVEKTGNILFSFIEEIDNSIESVTSIEKKTKSLDKARINVVDVVQNLTAIAEENAASTEETSASTEEVSSIVAGVSDSAAQLKDIAEGLEENMKIFEM